MRNMGGPKTVYSLVKEKEGGSGGRETLASEKDKTKERREGREKCWGMVLELNEIRSNCVKKKKNGVSSYGNTQGDFSRGKKW